MVTNRIKEVRMWFNNSQLRVKSYKDMLKDCHIYKELLPLSYKELVRDNMNLEKINSKSLQERLIEYWNI